MQAGVCVSDRDEIAFQSNQKIPWEFMSEESQLYDTIGNQPRSDSSYTCIHELNLLQYSQWYIVAVRRKRKQCSEVYKMPVHVQNLYNGDSTAEFND